MNPQRKNKGFFISCLIMAMSLLLPLNAFAVPMIMLDDGIGGNITIADGDAGDLTGGGDGTVLFQGALGSFTLIVSLGSASSPGGVPSLDFTTVASTAGSQSGGTLTASFTETGFSGPLPSLAVGSFQSIVSGNESSGNVTYEAFLDPLNAAFGTGISLTGGPIDSFSGSFNGETFSSAAPAIAGPYSLTTVFTLELGANQFNPISGTAELDGLAGSPPGGQPIPEPATVFLFGSGLVGVGLWRWKKMRNE